MVRKLAALFSTVLFFYLTIQAQSVSGTVTDALVGNPLKKAKVSIVELKKNTTTGINGNFTIDSVVPGTYTVRVEADNYLKLAKRIFVKSKKAVGTADLKLELKLYKVSSSVRASKGAMSVKYFFPGHGNVTIIIYDSKGNKVRRAFDRSRRGGVRSYSWDGRDDKGNYVKTGVYTCTVSCGTMVMNRRLEWKGANTR